MEHLKIDIYISDLLYQYDCVIVPDLGGFVANYLSAKIQPIHGIIQAPSKSISFNRNLKTNDGLLTSHIAQRKLISYEEAKSLIDAFVNHSIEGLKKGDKIRIDKVGVLFLDPEGNVQFYAEEQNDYLLDSFGLGQIQAKPIIREKIEERVERKLNEPIILQEEVKKRRHYWPAAASILLLVCSVFWLNQQFNLLDESKVFMSSFSFFNNAPGIYTEKDLTIEEIHFENINFEEKEYEADLEWIPYELEKEATLLIVHNELVVSSKIDNTAVDVEVSPLATFHVMGGCFSMESNAKGLVDQLRQEGFKAQLLGKYKSFHAVSYQSFTTRESALRFLKSIKEEKNPQAWLLVQDFKD